MIGLFLDTIVLFSILWWFLKDDMPDFKFVILIALGIGIVNAVLSVFAFPFIGFLIVIPSAIITGLVLMFYYHLPLLQASIGTAVFLVYKIGLIAALYAG